MEDIKVLKVDDNENINVIVVDDNINFKNNRLKSILKGKDGEDGYTPRKGVDYFTNEDIESLDIPRKTSDLINDEGYTSNEGTVTGVKMNGTTKGTSGVVDLGTVITEHQDISGKVDKISGKGLSTNDFTDAYKGVVDSNSAARHTHSNKSVIDNISSSDITNWNGKADIADIPDVSNFITKSVNDLLNYYKKTEVFTKQEVNDLIGSIENHFQYVTLSEDISNPTNIFDYANSSGLYVAKNNGFIGTETGGEVLTALAEGQFFSVFNLKNFEDIIGEEIPDENNIIKIEVPGVENYNYIFYKSGTDNWKQISTINSENISEYLPSEVYVKESAINMIYGLNFVNGYLALYDATETAIRTGTDQYHAITPRRGKYLVEYWGDQKYTTKTEFAELQSEIEDILDTVVSVNE